MRRLIAYSSVLIALSLSSYNLVAVEEAPKPTMKVDGAGFFKDRLLAQQLKSIFHAPAELFGPTEIEDAALILISDMQSDGYLEARIVGTITAPNGEQATIEWDKGLYIFLPKETQAQRIDFRVIPGPRFYYASLEVEENPVIDR